MTGTATATFFSKFGLTICAYQRCNKGISAAETCSKLFEAQVRRPFDRLQYSYTSSNLSVCVAIFSNHVPASDTKEKHSAMSYLYILDLMLSSL